MSLVSVRNITCEFKYEFTTFVTLVKLLLVLSKGISLFDPREENRTYFRG